MQEIVEQGYCRLKAPASLLRWPRIVLFSCVVDEQKHSSDIDVDKHINMLQATVLRGVTEFVELSRDVFIECALLLATGQLWKHVRFSFLT